ncbi:beta-ketoacyl-ACP synthase III [Allokutzneria albata]|uniref:Beta-ketoacyl-[acyl-carrier-protein] synthase III n=1 Tax=Allokutzneria albata TaxID=211114 RepID=A0A1H0CGM6_ALLAB|nr:beta-ketoacyl-ACP synthase III [Allokutzneria albata]SDN57015.1 3-oxoacyl-[acyl-carrier-protein] synthase-3 [Allokutzneria albata]
MTESRPLIQLPAGPGGSRLLGFGSAQGDRVVTNDDMAKIVETSDEWIRSRVGIAERRLATEEQSLHVLATEAGRAALADSGIDPSEVDTVIVATCTMSVPIPNVAARVADALGISGAGAFDLNAACAGFCYALGNASDLIRSGTARYVLVIGAERFSNWVDWQDRSTSIIFADGAGAAVVGPSDEPAIGPVSWTSRGDLSSTIGVTERNFLFQEGQSVFRWATTEVWPTAERAVERAGLKLSDVDALIPHQANLRIVETIARSLRGRGAREDMVVARDIVHSGNTSAASIPIAIDHMRKAGELSSGDVLLLVGFGAGLVSAGQVVICP